MPDVLLHGRRQHPVDAPPSRKCVTHLRGAKAAVRDVLSHLQNVDVVAVPAQRAPLESTTCRAADCAL
eukprot:357444-Chlamydomonas_euryale.AAC.1